MKTILLIEDNADILDNLTEYFQIEGYNIISAINGVDGVALAKQAMPDLIICDVLMPEMNGIEVLNELFFIIKTEKIPFVFSSSMSEKLDKTKALALGADDYIVKPFDPTTLLQMANDLITSREQAKALVMA